MRLVIDIPDFIYDRIRNITDDSIIEYNAKTLYNAIYHGTPLLKGHGRLIDADSPKNTLDYYIQEAGWGKEHNESLEWSRDEFIDLNEYYYSNQFAENIPLL